VVRADTKNNPAGKGSCRITSVASPGPLLCTVSVYSTCPPGWIEDTDAVLVSARSAPGLAGGTIWVSTTHSGPIMPPTFEVHVESGGPSRRSRSIPRACPCTLTE